MSEYLEWHDDASPVKVRIHRRVPAGLEQERDSEFRGILLGSVLPETHEVLVEDFARLGPGSDSRAIEQWMANRNVHSLPAVGYFRVDSGDPQQITDSERNLFDRYFPDPLNVLLLFELRNGKAQLPQVLLKPSAPPRQPAAAPPRTAPPPPPPVIPIPERPPIRERAAMLPPRAEPAPPPPSEPVRARRPSNRLLGQIAAVAAGFLIGVVGYLALRGDKPRPIPRTAPAITGKTISPAVETPVVPPATTPATAAGVARPSPFDEDAAVATADRSVDPGRGDAAKNQDDLQRQIRAAIGKWSDSLVNGDTEGHVNTYAPTVGRYFNKNNVPRSQVRDDVRRMVDKYGRMTSYKVSDVKVSRVDATHATATLRKKWATEGNRFAGDETERLKFVRQGSEWLITGEQEMKVYWSHRR